MEMQQLSRAYEAANQLGASEAKNLFDLHI